MSKIVSRDPDLCFAALKLMEQMNRDGRIPAHVFRNILNDYAGIVDLSKFSVMETKTIKGEDN